METTTKLAIGVSALCCLATSALAGGPEMAPMIDMNGFHIGLGFGYKSYKYDLLHEDNTGGTLAQINNEIGTVNKFGPVGEVGYTFAGDTWLFGIKGQFEYDDVRSTTNDGGVAISQAQVGLRSHVTAMLLGGVKLSPADALYLEGGYSALFAKRDLAITTSGGAHAIVDLSQRTTLSGGIAGIGYRHYFMSNVFFDVSYDFALYANRGATLLTSSGAGWFQRLSGVRKLTVNGITATANYLFNI